MCISLGVPMFGLFCMWPCLFVRGCICVSILGMSSVSICVLIRLLCFALRQAIGFVFRLECSFVVCTHVCSAS